MEWIDIAGIVFICVTMNHLGLISEIEGFMGKRLIVINCPKCSTFWATLIYGLWGIDSFYVEIIPLLAISFLSSYAALWLELIEGFIDTLYLKLYGKIYNTSDNAPSADPDEGYSASTLPKL